MYKYRALKLQVEDTKLLYIPGDTSNSSSDVLVSGKNSDSLNVNSADESRYLKMFQGLELNRHFYFSYTYNLTNSLQINMEPVSLIFGLLLILLIYNFCISCFQCYWD